MRRTFLAIDFDEPYRRLIGEYQRTIAPFFAAFRPSWVDPAIFHLTLHFFGDIDDNAISTLREKFSAIAGSIALPRLWVDGLRYLPGAANPKVLCLNMAMEPAESLPFLAVEARALAAGIGATCDDRPWKAHLTLARFKEGRRSPRNPVPALAALPIPPRLECSPESFALKESFLSPRGPRYETLQSFAFARAGAPVRRS